MRDLINQPPMPLFVSSQAISKVIYETETTARKKLCALDSQIRKILGRLFRIIKKFLHSLFFQSTKKRGIMPKRFND